MSFINDLFRDYNNPYAWLSAEGLVYRLGESALNGTATGPTSFATTTPTILVALAAASGLAMIPLEVRLFQAGTVAGGAITVLIEADNANRYTSGGTAATVMTTDLAKVALPTGATAVSCSGGAITATNAVGSRLAGYLLGQDVSPAEGAIPELIWTPGQVPEILKTTDSLGASFLVNTSAGTTGPTWFWSAKVAIFPLTWCK